MPRPPRADGLLNVFDPGAVRAPRVDPVAFPRGIEPNPARGVGWPRGIAARVLEAPAWLAPLPRPRPRPVAPEEGSMVVALAECNADASRHVW